MAVQKNVYSSVVKDLSKKNVNLNNNGLMGSSGEIKLKNSTGGIYAGGIEQLNPTLKNDRIVPKANMGVGVTGGGTIGGVTREGVITGSMGVTKLPSINPSFAGGSFNSNLGKYADFFKFKRATPSASGAGGTGSTGGSISYAYAGGSVGGGNSEESGAQGDGKDEIEKVPASYEEYYEQQKKLLDERKAQADKEAEVAKQKAAVDAQASYAQNKASYGANAEQLAQMGLTGSGYSDYINAQAYAQKRADVQQANATEQAAKVQNRATYEDALSELNANKLQYDMQQQEKAEAKQEQDQQRQDNIYASLWEGAINPDSGLTEESLATFAREYGLSEDKIQGLQQVLAQTKAKAEAEKSAALKQGALDNINSGAVNESNLESYLDTLKGQGASDKDIEDVRNTYQSNYYNDFMSQITSGTLSSTKAIDDAYKAGNLSDEHYENLKKAWNEDINTENNAFDQFGSYNEAKRAYEEIINNSWCSDETKEALRKSFETYAAKYFSSNVDTGYNGAGSTVTLNTPDGKVTVTYKVGSKSLKPSSGNAVFNSDLYKNAKSGQVFIVNGKPYVKLDNGDLGCVNDYTGQGAYEKLLNTYDGTVYDFS